jgi:hypothetical protein
MLDEKSQRYNNTAGSMRSSTRERSSRRSLGENCVTLIQELESKNLIDVQTSSIVKTFILEENVEIFKVFNAFIARTINERELVYRL